MPSLKVSSACYPMSGRVVLTRSDDKALTVSSEGEEAKKELFAAWALFISIMLLIAAFFTSYLLQQKKVTAIHETVISIFAGSSRQSHPSLLRCSYRHVWSLINQSRYRHDRWPHPRYHAR